MKLPAMVLLVLAVVSPATGQAMTMTFEAPEEETELWLDTAKPAVTAPPVTTAKPAATAPPVTTAKPAATAPPVTTAKPVATAPPVTTAKPVATAPPVLHPRIELCFVMSNAACPGRIDCTMSESKINHLRAALKEVVQANVGVELDPKCAKSANCKGCEVTFEVDKGTDTSQLDTCSGNPEASGCGALQAEGLQISAAATAGGKNRGDEDDEGVGVGWVVLAALLAMGITGAVGFWCLRQKKDKAQKELILEAWAGDLATQEQALCNGEGYELDSDDGDVDPSELAQVHDTTSLQQQMLENSMLGTTRGLSPFARPSSRLSGYSTCRVFTV